MGLLSLIHRWTGGFLGLLLALIGLSGAVLVWEGSWVGVPGADDRLVQDVDHIAAISEGAAARGELGRITFAGDEIGLHQLTYADGHGAYVRQSGEIAERWSSQRQRPELWLFDFHHHLFAGHIGETVTGIAGLAGIGFALTGSILWWRTRRNFAPRLVPKRLAPGPIVKHHRDLGILALPLLLLSTATGVMMLFEPVRTSIFGTEKRPEVAVAATADYSPRGTILTSARLFPKASIRRLTMPSKPGAPYSVRLRQPFEWTPNGRTEVKVSPGGLVTVADSAAADGSATAIEKLYPIHSAKVGGLAMKLAMTASGVALAMLGSLATWSFWFRRFSSRLRKRSARSGREAVQLA